MGKSQSQRSLIIGLGTGRCGTSSLSEWLGIPHEFRPYITVPDEGAVKKRLKQLQRYGGDVSFSNLNMLPFIDFSRHTVICLMRDREETIDSIHRFENKDMFAWTMNFTLNTRDDVARYYDWYYNEALRYNVIVIDPSQIPIRINTREELDAANRKRLQGHNAV